MFFPGYLLPSLMMIIKWPKAKRVYTKEIQLGRQEGLVINLFGLYIIIITWAQWWYKLLVRKLETSRLQYNDSEFCFKMQTAVKYEWMGWGMHKILNSIQQIYYYDSIVWISWICDKIFHGYIPIDTEHQPESSLRILDDLILYCGCAWYFGIKYSRIAPICSSSSRTYPIQFWGIRIWWFGDLYIYNRNIDVRVNFK